MKKILPAILTSSIFLTFAIIFVFVVSKSKLEVVSYQEGNIIFSQPGGFYPKPFSVSLKSSDESLKIRYTVDGSEPTKNSFIYENPIEVNSQTGKHKENSKYDISCVVIRACLFNGEKKIGRTVTNTYLLDDNIENRITIPVVSITTDEKNLNDYETGIFVRGKVFDQWRGLNPRSQIDGATPANYNQKGMEWERPVHVEFFEPNGKLGFSQDAGIRTFGGWSRSWDLKSVRIFARSEYDEKDSFDYEIFPSLKSQNGDGKYIDSFKSFILRNSGNDFGSTMLRDGVMQKLTEGSKVDIQAYRPSVVFINGDYWGILNLRADNDDDYIKNNYSANQDKVAIISQSYIKATLDHGDAKYERDYYDLLDFTKNNDLSKPDNYKKISERIDIDNFIAYTAFELYFGNTDWPQNNVRLWRYDTEGYNPDAPYGLDGRWRWILKDTDFGFGLVTKYWDNTLQSMEWRDSKAVPLKFLVKNEDFKEKFINYFADIMNTNLSPDHAIEVIDNVALGISNEMENNIKRWGGFGGSLEGWNNNVDEMRKFAEERPEYMRNFIKNYFKLEGTANISADIEGKGGKIAINTVEISNTEEPWKGVYFKGIPIKISAKPNDGYKFVEWKIDGVSSQADTITLVRDMNITARFEKISGNSKTSVGNSKVYINEIMSSDQKEGNSDWVELYNNSDERINLKNYYLSDDKSDLIKWQMSAVYIEPKGYLRIWCSGRDLRNPIEELHTNFSIKDGEVIYLTKYDGRTIVDSFKVVKTYEKQSFGRYPDGSDHTVYLEKATPDAKNKTDGSYYSTYSDVKDKIMINGKIVNNASLKVIDNVVLAPIKKLGSQLKITVDDYDPKDTKVIKSGKVVMEFGYGSDIVIIDGQGVKAEGAVDIFDNEVYVPLKFLAEKLNYDYNFVEASNSVVITHY